MTITAKVIAHSRASGAPDLITLEARYPRFIHAESKTHRVMSIDDAEVEFMQEISLMDDEKFSRNASSSRAIPTDKLIMSALLDCAMPVEWHYNEPGMQGTTVMSDADADEARMLWLEARDHAVMVARRMRGVNPHKQVINRLLEPFTHITTLITSTEWTNFFDLRCHPDADPTMRALAEAMRDAIEMSEPVASPYRNFWHLPYISDAEGIFEWCDQNFDSPYSIPEVLAMISAARCARVSYLTHSGEKPDIDKDLALARRLLESRHLSPFEHQGIADPEHLRQCEHANFTGWAQFRQMVA